MRPALFATCTPTRSVVHSQRCAGVAQHAQHTPPLWQLPGTPVGLGIQAVVVDAKRSATRLLNSHGGIVGPRQFSGEPWYFTKCAIYRGIVDLYAGGLDGPESPCVPLDVTP